MKVVVEGTVAITEEDGGQAIIAAIEDDGAAPEFFVRLQSWSEARRHIVIRSLAGKRVRVTVETID